MSEIKISKVEKKNIVITSNFFVVTVNEVNGKISDIQIGIKYSYCGEQPTTLKVTSDLFIVDFFKLMRSVEKLLRENYSCIFNEFEGR